LGLWKTINAILIPKIRDENYSADFCTRNIFWLGEPLCRPPLMFALSPGHSDINKFRSWSTIETGNQFNRTEKIPNMLRRLALLTILIRVQAFRDLRCGELPLVQIFINDVPNPIT
jgi:hypothetical protein